MIEDTLLAPTRILAETTLDLPECLGSNRPLPPNASMRGERSPTALHALPFQRAEKLRLVGGRHRNQLPQIGDRPSPEWCPRRARARTRYGFDGGLRRRAVEDQ